MLFTDPIFLFYFLPLALLAHAVTNRFAEGGVYPRASRACIFLFTLVFYGWSEPWWLVPFAFCLSCDFVIATALRRATNERARRGLVALSVFQNLAVLGAFKYLGFLSRIVAALAPRLAPFVPALTQNDQPLPLPPGISFYVFESLSFVIDVYRREVEPPGSPLAFFAFIGMFPRFVAGPIARYRDVAKQMSRYEGMQLDTGIFLFTIGFFLKCVFADSFAVFAGCAFDKWDGLSFLGAWVGVLSYTLQLYFDFSGYSLMALGLGRCFGFRFPVNFRCPYHATSLQDFWRRWHISLSTWLRDYLYIPLGGNRRGGVRTYLNLFLTMAIGGLWHGASTVFLIWGMWHGLVLCLERRFRLDVRLPRLVNRALTLVAVMIGWTFFKSSGLHQALGILQALASPARGASGFNFSVVGANRLSLFLCLVGALYCFVVEPRLDLIAAAERESLAWRERLASVLMFLGAAAMAISSAHIPFLYYQF